MTTTGGSDLYRNLAAAAAALTAVAALATPTLADDTESAALGASTRLGPTASTVVPVTLGEQVAVNLRGDNNPNFRIDGAGDFAALALVEQGQRGPAATLVVTKSSDKVRCGGPCIQANNPYTVQVLNGLSGANGPDNLPAGDYRMYVVSDAPASVDLTFPELSGSTLLQPGPAAKADLRLAAENRLSPVPGALTYSAGNTHRLAGKGLQFTQLTDTGGLTGPAEKGTCLYVGEEEAGDYAPGCPTAEIVGTSRSASVGTFHTSKDFGTTVGLAAGTYGLGGYIVRAGQVNARLVTLTVEY